VAVVGGDDDGEKGDVSTLKYQEKEKGIRR
jgi:hypothetical protein